MPLRMKTHISRLAGKAALLGLLAALPACSGSSDDDDGGAMFIVSCSLGCGNGSAGGVVGCSLVNISQNAEVVIQFSQPINISSVTSGSFRLVNLGNGTVPSGVYTIDPSNPRNLIFRPSLDFVGAGNPEFGFDPNQTYQLLILGEGQDPTGPYVRSASGRNNSTRMDCTVQTTEPLLDPVPGAPTMEAYVTSVIDPVTGGVIYDPVTNLPVGGQPLDGATELPTASRIVLIFDDIMNKATVANQINGQSNTMTVRIDLDGDLNDPSDQVNWPGEWSVDVDFDNLLRTTAVFTPEGGEFPSGGGDPMNPRKILVNVSSQLLDIVGLALENPSTSIMSTVTESVMEVQILEDFTTGDNEDSRASGGTWGAGRLIAGHGGGSGRLGPLLIPAGQMMTLDTDSEEFPLDGQTIPVMSNEVPGTDYDPALENTWPTISIDSNPFGEAFEFSRIEVDGTLILTGSQPVRLFARGEAVFDGVLDLTGESPAPHESNSGGDQPANVSDGQLTKDGGLGADGGPSAGAGGQGADRIDMSGTTGPVMINIGGINNPGAVNVGRSGVGVGGIPDGTGGVGGENWPPMLPQGATPGTPEFGDAELSWIQVDADSCRVAMVAGPGSGGSHALPGEVGMPISPFVPAEPGLIANTPTPTPGGDNSALDLEAPGSAPSVDNKRNLEFWRKHLRGGSGGGGGGTSIYASRMNGATGPDCSTGSLLFPLWDHSAAGGGGGGGAIQIAAGQRIALNNQIDCRGGAGGSATVPGAAIELCVNSGSNTNAPDCEKYASPGGGGAGGGVRLQAPVLEFANQPGRIDVSGGAGGLGAGGSIGGEGSPGLVRLEYLSFSNEAADAAVFGPLISPSLPADMGFNTPFTSAAILSIGLWQPQVFRPESFSGSQSCWLEPQVDGALLGLDFVDDVAGAPDDLSRFGWNMDIVYDVPGVGERFYPYRGVPPVDSTDEYDEVNFPTTELGGLDFETFFGTTLNHEEPSLSTGSLLVIRFQGVRTSMTPDDLCNLDLNGQNVEPDSLTPWVFHPAQLNLFSPQPNLIRFTVVFDEQLKQFDPIVLQNVKGVSNLRIRVQPL